MSKQREEVLTPSTILWGRQLYPVDDTESSDAEKLTMMTKGLEDAEAHAWKREYVHSLMESHGFNKERGCTPRVGEIALIVGEEKNRGNGRERWCALFKETLESLEELHCCIKYT